PSLSCARRVRWKLRAVAFTHAHASLASDTRLALPDRSTAARSLVARDSQPTARGTPSGVWQLAWPAVLTNLLQSTVGLIDVKVVGTLGPSAVAAATAGHRL